jgi:Zn-dependent peptidase ImmA (M78 family)
MLEDLESGAEIAHRADSLLRAADAHERLPTPVEDIVAAAELQQAKESWLAESALAGVPAYLARKVDRLKGRVHAALDRKTREIHISPHVEHDGQRRFKTLHEVGHDILDWQQDAGYVDDQHTLSWRTHVTFEQEANQCGAELLFKRERFQTMASDYEVGFPAIIALAELLGASIHASFRRYVETHRQPIAGLVLASKPCKTDPVGYRRREAISSHAWSERYDAAAGWPSVLYSQPYSFVEDIGLIARAPRTTMIYPDVNNEPTELRVELFSNSYYVFVLMWVPRRERFKRKRVIVPASLGK